MPGLGNSAGDYKSLEQRFKSRGLAVRTAPINRIDWSRNAAALTDVNWWRGSLRPRPAVDWYMTRMDQAMQELKREADGAPITILTHSAGGWLGRVYMLDYGVTGVDRFVSLGSPHLPPPKGIVDQTRGILNFVQDACPGAFHPEVQYVTVAGKYVKGVALNQEGTLKEKFAGLGYQQVCGNAEVWGDVIVPVDVAHLEGALNIDIEGAFHSPLGANSQLFGPWYGSDEHIDVWEHHATGTTPTAAASIGAVSETKVQV